MPHFRRTFEPRAGMLFNILFAKWTTLLFWPSSAVGPSYLSSLKIWTSLVGFSLVYNHRTTLKRGVLGSNRCTPGSFHDCNKLLDHGGPASGDSFLRAGHPSSSAGRS